MALSAGMPAPDFSLPDETRKLHQLSDYRGKKVLLYFYPKDDTPGCTKEACNFRDDYHRYQAQGVVILGASPDSPKSHVKFKEKYGLPFPLLSDADHAMAEAYGAWGRKKFMGREYDGILRTTYLIDENGMIETVFEAVKPEVHSAEVLELFK